jgi:hypothetical protein
MVMAVLVTLGYLPWHRRRVTPELADALGHATHEPARSGRPATELELLTFSAVAALSCAAVAGVLWMSRAPFGPTWLALLGGAAVSGAIAWSMASRLFDGRGLAEPLASDYALSGRLYLVTEFPAGAEDAVVAESAVDLRHLAESHRLPILHRVDPDTGVQDFLLITVRHGSFSWRASPTGPTPIVAPTR